METICTFFLNYQQYIILLTICFFRRYGMAASSPHQPLVHHCRDCVWVIYVYRYQIAVGWPALDVSGELSLRELLRRRLHTALVFSTLFCRSSWRSTGRCILIHAAKSGQAARIWLEVWVTAKALALSFSPAMASLGLQGAICTHPDVAPWAGFV